jgi:protoporphyrin/coproporphyrin ferrochelatase
VPPEPAKQRLAIILFNLGGPDQPASIRPFLLNLFRDPAILRVPFFVRPLLARVIARARVAPATENYSLIGGKSPLLELTQDQARALEADLQDLDAKCFVAMRYWHPFSDEVARQVRAWKPDRILLLPLYPQYSTTTAGSSIKAWQEAAARAGLVAEVTTLCCWFEDPGYTGATAAIVADAYTQARTELDPAVPLRVLFSAHGLPEIIVKSGDPYQLQVERTVASVVNAWARPGVDWAICYQSRATPQKWIGPSTEEEIERAAHDKVAVLVVPIAFVSDHSETLVELDIEYREVALKAGVPGYFRAPAQNSDPRFIAALADIVRRAWACGPGLCSYHGARVCPATYADCPNTRVAA